MNIPPKYEDVVAQLEAANELAYRCIDSADRNHLRAVNAEGNVAALREELERATSRYDRDVLGLNNEGDPIGGDPAGGYKNDLARANAAFDELAFCVGFSEARLDQTGDSPMDCANQLQQRLTVAEQRAAELESAAREMLRIAGIANQGSNAYNRAIINLHAALKPAEEATGSTCNQIREESGLPTKNPCVACNNGACIDR